MKASLDFNAALAYAKNIGQAYDERQRLRRLQRGKDRWYREPDSTASVQGGPALGMTPIVDALNKVKEPPRATNVSADSRLKCDTTTDPRPPLTILSVKAVPQCKASLSSFPAAAQPKQQGSSSLHQALPSLAGNETLVREPQVCRVPLDADAATRWTSIRTVLLAVQSVKQRNGAILTTWGQNLRAESGSPRATVPLSPQDTQQRHGAGQEPCTPINPAFRTAQIARHTASARSINEHLRDLFVDASALQSHTSYLGESPSANRTATSYTNDSNTGREHLSGSSLRSFRGNNHHSESSTFRPGRPVRDQLFMPAAEVAVYDLPCSPSSTLPLLSPQGHLTASKDSFSPRSVSNMVDPQRMLAELQMVQATLRTRIEDVLRVRLAPSAPNAWLLSSQRAAQAPKTTAEE